MNNIDIILGNYFDSFDIEFFFALYILKLLNWSFFEMFFTARSKIQWPTAAATLPVMLAASISFWTTSKCKRIQIKLCFHTQFGI